jgi:type III pantothenate kinase
MSDSPDSSKTRNRLVMTPDVVVDIGNSRMKWGRCADGRVITMESLGHDEPVEWKRLAELWKLNGSARWAVAGVAPRPMRRFGDWLSTRNATVVWITNELFTERSPTGLVTSVEEPEGIGVDRLLAALASFTRVPARTSAVAISVGTAMTIDFVEPDGTHVGGAILPGPELMARSLRQHTAKLPHIDIDPVLPEEIWGTNTHDAIQLGIANAILGAADQLVWDWSERSARLPWVFATGGDVEYFRGFEFTADVGKFLIDPNLILEGIRIAAEALP